MGGGRSGPGQDGLGGGRCARHRRSNALALQRIDETGCITDQEHAAARWHGSDHSHLEPTAHATPIDWGRQQTLPAEVVAERVELGNGSRCRRTVGPQSEPQPDIRSSGMAREDPAVTRKSTPVSVVPQHDDRTIDRLRNIAPLCESPEYGGGVDEAGVLTYPACGSIGPDDDIGNEAATIVEFDIGATNGCDSPGDRFGAGGNCVVAQPGVEAHPGDGDCVAGIGAALPSGEHHASPGGTDHDHVAHLLAPVRMGDTERRHQRQSARSDEITARLVSRKRGSVDKCYPGASTGQHQRSDAAGRPGTDHRNIECCNTHIVSEPVATGRTIDRIFR